MDDLLMSAIPVTFVLFVFVLIPLMAIFRRVPPNTAIIVDKDFHYYKTKKRGFYFVGNTRYKITTYISKAPHVAYYSQISETHDGNLLSLTYWVEYKVSNVDEVLERLKSNRRSVDDIIQSCVKTSLENFNSTDIYKGGGSDFSAEVSRRLAVNFAAFEIELINVYFTRTEAVSETYRDKVFAPHISQGDNPIKYN